MSKLVVPGELLSNNVLKQYQMASQYVYYSKEGTHAAVLGVYDEKAEKFIPLKGPYIPVVGDRIVGIIEEERVIGYVVEILSPYKGFIFSRSTRMHFSPGDVITADVENVSEVKDVTLTHPHLLRGGSMTAISPTKVSRAIGKKSSMLNILQKGTGCDIIIGKNGGVWIKGNKVEEAIDAFMRIEKEAHISGLTDRIAKMLEVEQ